jgi:hypothetical protein
MVEVASGIQTAVGHPDIEGAIEAQLDDRDIRIVY